MAVVTRARYRALTGDLLNYDGDVDRALSDAQSMIEEYLDRPLENAQRTEQVTVYSDGALYPKATPITAASGYTIVGTTKLTGSYVSTPLSTWPDYQAISLTYTGGWTANNLPKRLEKAIVMTAKSLLDTNALLSVGAKAVSVGDLSITYDKPSTGELPGGVKSMIRVYKRKAVIA